MVPPLPQKPVLLHPLLRDALQRAMESGEPMLVRLPEPKAPRDPWELANAALWTGQRATIWSDPSAKYAAVGLLDAWHLRSEGHGRFSSLQRQLDAVRPRTLTHPELAALPLWFGGFRFGESTEAASSWAAWPAAELLTHAITFVKAPERSFIVLSLVVQPDATEQDLHNEYARLRHIVATLRAMQEDERAFDLDFEVVDPKAAWTRKVRDVQTAIAEGKLKKLVLARRVVARWPEEMQSTPLAARLLPALRLMRNRYSHCTTFALSRGESDGNSVFFGSTPELLIARTGERLQTMALAGTASRGETLDADRLQTQGLLASPKEREEHAFVVQDIVQNLAKIDVHVRAPSAPDVLTFRNVHHLCTPIHGEAPPDRGLLHVADALHPTPAICGTETKAAFDWIRAHEGMERGWYAGGVAWLNDRGEGRISVALRSGIALPSGVCAYAGAGIVEGSDADLEWDETHAKLSPVCDAFQANATMPPRRG